MKKLRITAYILVISSLILLYQNCSGEFSGLDHNPTLNKSAAIELSNDIDKIIKPLIISSIESSQITSNSLLISFTTNYYSKARIYYHTEKLAIPNDLRLSDRPLNISFTKGEDSFKYKHHKQYINQLKPNTTYYFKIIAENGAGLNYTSEVGELTTEPLNISYENSISPPTNSPKGEEGSNLWLTQGYDLVFSSTPNKDDINNDPKKYFEEKWNNGFPLIRYIATNNLKIAYAPDGSPSAHVSYKAGEFQTAASIIGNQLGPKGPEAQVVFSLETYFECIQGQTPKLYQYMGHGHHWGSEDFVNAMPGGSNNRDDSWSFRIPISKSGYYFSYSYIPDKNVVYGRSFLALEPKPKCGSWEKMELEIIQNNPVTAKNGIIRMYLNDILIKEQSGLQLRTRPTVRPKGLGYFVQQQNQNNQTLNIYTKNWKIYLK